LTDWTDVARTVAECHVAYFEWLSADAELRAGSKKHVAAYQKWTESHTNRAAALKAAFDPELDDEAHPLGSTLQRYYKENRIETKVKR
jgi:hypothetical protein